MLHTLQTPAVLAIPLLALLAGCGSGGGDGEAPAAPRYARQITFGDSLSDVGTYAVGAIAQAGGGKFTINGDSTAKDPALTGKVWVEVLAAQLGLAAPCAAQTGLLGRAGQGFSVPVQDRPGCYNYAMGGARVTDPVGPGNAATGSPLGALTIPVAAQVEQHLSRSGGKFDGDDIVFVMAGGNDALTLLRAIQASAGAAASKAGAAEGGRAAAQAASEVVAANAAMLVAQMAAAGTELATIVTDRIVGRGATRVVVVNLPDLGSTPGIRPLDAPIRQLVDSMVDAFNGALAARIDGRAAILHVDIRTPSREHVMHPERFGLTNTTDPACGPNPLDRNSLVCSSGNLVAGNVGRYMFADDVHPTPFEHTLIAQLVAERLAQRGWIGRERAALTWGPSAPPACRATRLDAIAPAERPSVESMAGHPNKSCEPV